MFLDIEEIRHTTEMNQTDFARAIDMPFRTYQKRIHGETEWLISEIIKASQFNDGEIHVESLDGGYDITVKKV